MCSRSQSAPSSGVRLLNQFAILTFSHMSATPKNFVTQQFLLFILRRAQWVDSVASHATHCCYTATVSHLAR